MKYIPDLPINADDVLDVCDISDRIYQTIQDLSTSENKETFTIAITGKWGSGKTSTLNGVLYEVEQNNDCIQSQLEEIVSNIHVPIFASKQYKIEHKEKERQRRRHLVKHIVVRFNPWNVVSTDRLVYEFLTSMMSQIRNNRFIKNETQHKDQLARILNITNNLLRYGKRFLPYLPHWYKTLAGIFEDTVGRYSTGRQHIDCETLKERISKSVSELDNYRILIVIDDIDRLTNDQIRYVFQMVNAIANFKNTTYLLSFDKNIVTAALNKIQDGGGSRYLEKLINLSFTLKENNSNAFADFMFFRLEDLMGKDYEDLYEIIKYKFEHLVIPYIIPLFGTIRDVIRVYNVLVEKSEYLQGELDLIDVLYVATLEVLFPEVYEWIKMNKHSLTKTYIDSIPFNSSDNTVIDEFVDFLNERYKMARIIDTLKRGLQAVFFDAEEHYRFYDKLIPDVKEVTTESMILWSIAEKRLFYSCYFNRYFAHDHKDVEEVYQVKTIIYHSRSIEGMDRIMAEIHSIIYDTYNQKAFFELYKFELIKILLNRLSFEEEANTIFRSIRDFFLQNQRMTSN